MGVDKSYGSGYKNTGKAKPLTVAQKRTAAVSSRRVTGSAGSPITRNMQMASQVRTGKAKVADPYGVDFGFALPVNKLIEAARVLTAAGKIKEAGAVTARVLAKREGQLLTGNINDVAMRAQSESVFPRIGSRKIRTAPNRILEMQGKKRALSLTEPRVPYTPSGIGKAKLTIKPGPRAK